MSQKNIRKLLEMSCILLAQAQMLHEEAMELAQGQVPAGDLSNFHPDVVALVRRPKEAGTQ